MTEPDRSVGGREREPGPVARPGPDAFLARLRDYEWWLFRALILSRLAIAEWPPSVVGLYVAVGLCACVRRLFTELEETGIASRERERDLDAAIRASARVDARAAALSAVRARVDETLPEVRARLQALRRRRLDGGGWQAELDQLDRLADHVRYSLEELRGDARGWAGAHTIAQVLCAAAAGAVALGARDVHLCVAGCDDLALPEPDAAVALGRFVEEVVWNAHKHGRPPIVLEASAAGDPWSSRSPTAARASSGGGRCGWASMASGATRRSWVARCAASQRRAGRSRSPCRSRWPPMDDGGAVTVVVADDEWAWRESVVSVLSRRSDVEVVGQAETAERALELVRIVRPRVALVDLQMPAMGGTPRERDVLALLATGATNREIAGALVITEQSVKNHVRNILAKLRAPNRAAAAVTAHREGLVPGG